MKRITSKVIALGVIAAVAPLLIYGFVSISSLRRGTEQSVTAGNLNVATRAAEQIDLFVSSNIKTLQAVAADLHNTSLESWQQERILRNYVLEFPEFREITLFTDENTPTVSSRVGAPHAKLSREALTLKPGGVSLTPMSLDNDLLPLTSVTVPVAGPEGARSWLVGEFNLDELWRMVDRIRVGQQGFALVSADSGQLIAHGSPKGKQRVARGENLAAHPLVRQMKSNSATAPVFTEYIDSDGEPLLAVAAPIRSLGWTVMVEQPTSEAYGVARQLERQLIIAIALALFVTILFGYLGGSSLIRRILALMRGTRALAEGRLEERVTVRGEDELSQLGDAFNSMADRLLELQANVRRQERQAMFGRIAVGLVHDISHPIQNIGNSCRLILKMSDDEDYRQTFRRTVDREFAAIKRVLDDLRHIARPAPVERFPVDLNRSISDVVEVIRPHADQAGVELGVSLSPDAPFIEGDLFALGRVYRNLLINAIQATAPGGAITVSTERNEGRARVRVADTGCGIPAERLAAIFEDFVTTKRRGLGLGLAISKTIVEQLDGTIAVTSEVGRGTTFLLDFPEIRITRPLEVASQLADRTQPAESSQPVTSLAEGSRQNAERSF